MRNTKFFNLLFNVVAALVIGICVSQISESSGLTEFQTEYSEKSVDAMTTAVVVFLAFSAFRVVAYMVHLHKSNGRAVNFEQYAFMAVQVETWEKVIAENIFKKYPWVERAKDRSENVLAGKVVHIPQAGNKPGASKNREVYPLPVIKRSDSDVTYSIAEISTDATYIPHAETIELSYDKTASVLQDHFGVSYQVAARDILDTWYPTLSTKIVRTTGASTAVYLTGQTGNRKKFMVANVESAKTIINIDTGEEQGNRALIMTEGAYNQLKSDPIANNLDTRDSVGAVWKDGDLIKLHGYDIIRTDVTSRYDNSSTPVKKSFEDMKAGVFAAADNDVMLLVDFSKVHFAKGQIEFFETLKDAQYQGDIHSAKIRTGGRKERADEIGVVAIIQDAA